MRPTTLMEKRYTRQKNATYYSDEDTTLSLDDVLLEFSAEGKGDYRIPLVAVSAGENGERTADFRYKGYMRHEGIAQISGLPQAKADKTEAESLLLVFEDERLGLTLTLTYTIFPELDAIVRKSSLKASKSCIIRSLASSQLDFRSDKIRITAFSGAWGREFERYEKALDHGTFVSESRQMGSSAEANPGFLFDLRSVPLVARIVGNILPATHYMELLKTLFLAGDNMGIILRDCAALIGYAILFMGVAIRFTRKKLD